MIRATRLLLSLAATTASLLGISPKTLYNKLQRMRLN